MENTPVLSHEFLGTTLKRVVETENNAILLYACESGSRGWGFSSPDSDYDGRCIHLWPTARYLSPFPPEDIIGYQDPDLDLDFESWSLSKVLLLLRGGNPVVLEWLQSPVVYHDAPGFKEAMLSAFGGSPALFNPYASVSHYYGTARKMIHHGAKLSFGEPQVGVKALFYALRSLLAGLYVVDKGTAAPMSWEALLSGSAEDRLSTPGVMRSLEKLMVEKTANGEKHHVGYPTRVKDLLDSGIRDLERYMADHRRPELPPEKPYVDFFHYAVKTWGATL